MTGDAELPAAAPRPRCPQCGKDRVEKYRPFCSKRCADIDLHKWFSGTYAVAAVEDDEPEEEPSGKSA